MIEPQQALALVEEGFEVQAYSSKNLSFKVRPLYGHGESFDIVYERFKGKKIYPFYRRKGGEYYLTLNGAERKEVKIPGYAHLLLLFATLVTVSLAGYLHWAEGDIKGSFLFAGGLMGILGIHELGHYVQARIKKTEATLPFFIPMPPNIFPFGTLGAVITMGEPLKDRSALIRVGIAGPLAGFLLSLPVLYLGLENSTLIPVEQAMAEDELVFIMPLAMQLISGAVLNPGPQASIDPHPLAMAGWIGLFVTSINMIPLGQLDGGHVLRALFPYRSSQLYKSIFILLIAMGILVWPGWLMWALVAYALTRLRHPGPLNDVTGMSRKEKLIALVYVVVMAMSFVPVPFLPAGSAELLRQ